MEFALLMLLALLPGAAWLFFLAWQSRTDAGFRMTLLKVFFLGMTICIPAGYFNTTLMTAFLGAEQDRGLEHLFVLLLVVGPVEEGLKFLILYSEVYRRWQIRSTRDGVLLATASAIGFATFENAHYMERFGVNLLLLRGWACVLAHVGFSAVFGHYLALAKLRRFNEKACLVEGLAFAALLHALYDYTVSWADWVVYSWVIGLMALYATLRQLDLRPLSVMLVPSLANAGDNTGSMALFRPRRFPVAAGAARARADQAVAAMDSDDGAMRLEGLQQGRPLEDSRVFEKVRELTHDPVDAVRAAAAEVLAEMKVKLKRR